MGYGPLVHFKGPYSFWARIILEDGIEKIVFRNHRLFASQLIPIGGPQDGFFYPTLTLIIDSYNPDIAENFL